MERYNICAVQIYIAVVIKNIKLTCYKRACAVYVQRCILFNRYILLDFKNRTDRQYKVYIAFNRKLLARRI